MGFALTGLIASASAVALLGALFAFEKRRGERLLPRLRRHCDYFVLRTGHSIRAGTHYLMTHVFRQIGHYFVHVILSGALLSMQKGERFVRTVMRTNKTSAKAAERERASRSKLEEIALHKMETALTEEERAVHKERALNG